MADDPKQYVLTAISSFIADPRDSDFQRGYLAAMETVYREAFNMKGYRSLINPPPKFKGSEQ